MTERQITDGQRRRASKQEARIVRAVGVLEQLRDPFVLAELMARLEQPSAPDGYPTSSGGNGSPSADDSSSVERALGALYVSKDDGPDHRRVVPDPIREAGKRLLGNLAQIERLAIDALRQRDVILNSHVVRGRVNSIPICQACGKDVLPADGGLRGGYCDACRQAWKRLLAQSPLGQADRPAFERERRQRMVTADE